jgi:hypothetical protein
LKGWTIVKKLIMFALVACSLIIAGTGCGGDTKTGGTKKETAK